MTPDAFTAAYVAHELEALNAARPQPVPAVVWMVREPADCPCECPGDPVALFPTKADATEFTGRLEHLNRKYVIERWEVPGLE